jgi:uncharacterized protein YecE (DUF72 family)
MGRRPASVTGQQLDLFGAASPSPTVNDGDGRVRPVPPEAALVELAARLPAGLRLGTSSWSFPGWAGLVFAGRPTEAELSRHGLEAYARHPLLRAVGLDRTFYAPMSAGELARHAAMVTPGFRFLVKASQLCTFPSLRSGPGRPGGPNPRFLDAAFAREMVVAPAVEGLGDRLGTLLFQFPPLPRSETRDPARFAARLAAFLEALPRGPPYSVEIRDRTLLGQAYATALAASGAAHGFTVHPSMPPLAEQAMVLPVERQPALVVRWMLGHGRGYEEGRDLYAPFDRLAAPDPASRAAVAGLCRAATAAGREALVVVNNKAEGSSPLSLVELARALVGPPPGGDAG